jgi:hypothetical protein
MKRRSFLTGLLTATATVALPHPEASAAVPTALPEMPVGTIVPSVNVDAMMMYAGNGRVVMCDGQLLNATEYPELFGVIADMFGGAHTLPLTGKMEDQAVITRFAMPDFRAETLNEDTWDASCQRNLVRDWNETMLPILNGSGPRSVTN